MFPETGEIKYETIPEVLSLLSVIEERVTQIQEPRISGNGRTHLSVMGRKDTPTTR